MLGLELFFLVFPRIIRRFSIPDNSWPSWTKSQPCKPQQLDFARLGFRFGLPDTAGILPGYCWVRDYVVAMRRDFLVIETFRHSRSGVRVHSSWGKARWKTILASAPQFPGFGFYQIRIQTKLVLIRSGHQTPLDL